MAQFYAENDLDIGYEEEQEILTRAQKNVANWYTYWSHNIWQGRQDAEFLYNLQWTISEISELRVRHKDQLQFNYLYDHFKKIVAELLQNTPNFHCYAKSSDTPQELVDIVDDIYKNIWAESKGDVITQRAYENELARGYAAYFVVTEYEEDAGFNQVARVITIDMPENAFFDPAARTFTKTDGKFCGYLDYMPLEEFKATYNIDFPVSFPLMSEVMRFNHFYDRKEVVIAHYYEKEFFEKTVYLLDTGEQMDKEEYDELKKEYKEYIEHAHPEEIIGLPTLPTIAQKKKVKDCRIKCYKMIKNKILEVTEFPAKKILPGALVVGENYYLDGREFCQSFHYHAKDAQRFLNLCAIEILQAIKNSRRERFIGTKSNVAGVEHIWRNPDYQQGILLANPDKVTGRLPEQLAAEPINPSLIQQYERAAMDIQSILGRFESSKGQDGNATSGLDTQLRRIQASMGTKKFVNGITNALLDISLCLAEVIPNIYDTEREIPLKGADGRTMLRKINEQMEDGSVKNDLSQLKGKLGVEVKLGANEEFQKAHEMTAIAQFISFKPDMFPVFADIMAEAIESKNMPEIVKRAKRFIVPEPVIADEEGREPQPQPPDQQMMLVQQEMAIKQQEQQLKAQELHLKEQLQQIEAARLIYEHEKNQATLAATQMKTGAEIRKSAMDYDASMYSNMAKIATAHQKIQQAKNQNTPVNRQTGAPSKTRKY